LNTGKSVQKFCAAKRTRFETIEKMANDYEDWPFLRRCAVCVVCQGEKAVGKIVCDNCRETKTFLSMVPHLERAEVSMRWNAERQPDRPAPKQSRDPKLGPCPKCRGAAVQFMRLESPGAIVAGRITPRVNYYVLCGTCGNFTVPRSSKKLAAAMWV
jgi:hypothetical protein